MSFGKLGRGFGGLGLLGGASGLPPLANTFLFAGASSMPALTSFTRASGNATYWDVNGDLQTAGVNVPRFGYDFGSGRAIGLISEKNVANQIRNNTMVGVAAGTPGTLPTNWTINHNSNGLGSSVIGSGTQRNIPYVDVRIFGTTSGVGATRIYFDATNVIGGASGFGWNGSAFLSIVGGSAANLSNISLDLENRTSGNVFVNLTSGLNINTNVLTNNIQRFDNSLTGVGGTIAFSTPLVTFTPSGAGVAIDITIRIGAPQMEGGGLSNVILTSGTSLTRAADYPQFTGAAAALLNTTSYSVIAKIGSFVSSTAPFIGANGANYIGFGYDGTITTSQGNGVNQLSVALTEAGTLPLLAGLSVGGTRRISSNGGSLRGGATATDAIAIPIGPVFGNDTSGALALSGSIEFIKLYSGPFSSTGLLESATNQIQTTVWGDSLSAGTGSVTPSINFGFSQRLAALTGIPVNIKSYPGQGSNFIATQMLADTLFTQDNVVIEVGRNDTNGIIANVIADIQSMVNKLVAAGNTRYVILTILNSTAENSAATGPNLTAYNWVVAANAAIIAAFPGHVADVQAAVIAASSGPNNAPPASFMYQASVHPNDAGYIPYAPTIRTAGQAVGFTGY